jgi:hypothetical protein
VGALSALGRSQPHCRNHPPINGTPPAQARSTAPSACTTAASQCARRGRSGGVGTPLAAASLSLAVARHGGDVQTGVHGSSSRVRHRHRGGPTTRARRGRCGLIVCACPRPASSPLHCRQRSPAPRSPTRNAGRNHRPQQRVLVVGEVRRTAAVQAAVAHARAADGARSAARAGATRAFRRAKCGAGAVARSSMRCGTVWHASQPARRRAATEDDQVSPSVVLLIACRFELTHPRLLPQGTEASGHVSFRQQRAGRRRHLGRERRGGGPRAAGNQRGGRHGDGGCRCTCSAG